MTDPDRAQLTVLHVSQPGDGGVASCVRDLVRDQVGRGWRVFVAGDPGSELADATEIAGAELLGWQATRSPGASVAAETGQLARIIRSADPDLVHLHSSKAGLAGRLALRGRLPTVFQPHSWSFEAVGGVVRRAAIVWERLGARWAHAILCVSNGERERGVEQGIRGRFTVIPNGVDLVAFPPANHAARLAARSRLALGEEPIVVCTGRLCHQKGQDRLVEAWPAVRARVNGATLILVGAGEDEQVLRERAADGVRLAGHRVDIADWLAAADVVAMPSRWEGMALGLLEAMATGRSVVATDVGGAREALQGGAGAVVPANDGRAFVDALVRRLVTPELREAEGATATRKARATYDVQTTLDGTAALYQGL